MRTLPRVMTFAGVLALSASPAFGQSATTGEWTLHREVASPNRVQLELSSDEGHDAWRNSHAIDGTALGLPLADLDSPGKHVRFTLAREAGAFDCEGWAGNGKGNGTFAFAPNAAFFASLKRRGYAEIDAHRQIGIAAIDLTLPYIDALAAAGYPHLALGDLIAFRALRIDRAYVDALARAGYPHPDADQLVQLKALGVDEAYLRHLADHGFHNLPVAKLVQLKALGI